ncbi:MAG: molybdopterin converting factor subunit 1 [Pseudomonadota bacterium]
MIRVLYFAALREAVGRGEEALKLPEGVANVAALRAWLRARGEPWSAALAEERPVRAAVNQDMAGAESVVRDGDEVAFFPPVTGG